MFGQEEIIKILETNFKGMFKNRNLSQGYLGLSPN